MGSYAVRATVKQILNTCVACARGLQDFEVSFSSDDEEPSVENSDDDEPSDECPQS